MIIHSVLFISGMALAIPDVILKELFPINQPETKKHIVTPSITGGWDQYTWRYLATP
jgi:hypothetical protein